MRHPPIGSHQVLEERDRIAGLEELARQVERQVHLQTRRITIAVPLEHARLPGGC